MICRRRLCRNQWMMFLFIFIIGIWFYLKSFVMIPRRNQAEYNLPKTHLEVVEEREEAEYKKPSDITEKELQRLAMIEQKVPSDQSQQEQDELMKKFNESLMKQKIDEDPFHEQHLAKNRYTDFAGFKINFTETKYLPEHLLSTIDRLNQNPTIHNREKLKKLPKEHAVIIVQVHKRIEYFKELLDSLQRSRGIEESLLIISHDFYCDEMNALVRIIKFCPVIQIFFPFSLQLYPNKFPGPSKDDCPRNIKKEKARELGCVNAESPDKYGHYREAPIVMIKHHWWWKINMVMDGLEETKHHKGPFLFIEEDHYVAPSFLHALMTLHSFRKRDSSCVNSCDILTLGTYNNKENFNEEGSKVMHGEWISSQHNMGMSLYRDTWEKFKNCANVFCTYDDYNWDWTLMHISKSCLNRPLSVLLYEVPRVYHVGDCGLHHKKTCNTAKDTLNKIKSVIERNKDFIFVDNINTYIKRGTISMKPNGGWGDSRDHSLCLQFVQQPPPL